MNVLGKLPSLEKHFVLSLNFHERVPCVVVVDVVSVPRGEAQPGGLVMPWSKRAEKWAGHYLTLPSTWVNYRVCVCESFTVIFSCNDFNFGFFCGTNKEQKQQEQPVAGTDQVGRLAVLDPPPGLLTVCVCVCFRGWSFETRCGESSAETCTNMFVELTRGQKILKPNTHTHIHLHTPLCCLIKERQFIFTPL